MAFPNGTGTRLVENCRYHSITQPHAPCTLLTAGVSRCSPSLPRSSLQQLRELNLFSCPATNAASALQPCTALRRLVLGTQHYAAASRRAAMDGGPLEGSFGAAYEDEEASRWEAAYLDSVRAALPWVTAVGARHTAQLA